MKLWKNCLVVVGLGLLLLLVSCSKDVSRDSTEGFLSGLSTMMGEAMMNESNQVLSDFIGSNPPGPELPDIPGLSNFTEMPGIELCEQKFRALRAPYGIDSLYGTWRYNILTDEWYLFYPGNPESAILFEWPFLDSASVAHTARIRIDSLEFYQDSLPTDVWAGIKIDDDVTWLAWLKLEATYVSLEQVSAVSFVYEIVGYYQAGISISSPTAIDSNFVGTVNLWVIDRTSNDYRVDLTVTRNGDDSGELVLEDSDGWKMEVDVTAVVETDGIYERRDVSGEITSGGTHAASIDGVIWEPEDDTHYTEIVVTFSDGSANSLLAYFSEDFVDLGE